MPNSFEEFHDQMREGFWRRRPRKDWISSTISMTSDEEKQMLYEVVAQFPRPLNAIVDAGSFLGASTLAFGMRLEA